MRNSIYKTPFRLLYFNVYSTTQCYSTVHIKRMCRLLLLERLPIPILLSLENIFNVSHHFEKVPELDQSCTSHLGAVERFQHKVRLGQKARRGHIGRSNVANVVVAGSDRTLQLNVGPFRDIVVHLFYHTVGAWIAHVRTQVDGALD